MLSQVAHAGSVIVTLASTIFGAKTFVFLGEVTHMSSEMPEWMRWLLGPLGALVGMIVAIWWLTRRLDKVEAKAEKREAERDEDRKALITVVQQNSNLLAKVDSHLQNHVEQ